MFPVLRAVPVEDASPLSRPPSLERVPRAAPADAPPQRAGLGASLLLAATGALAMARGRRLRP
jgi:hypothetical protein